MSSIILAFILLKPEIWRMLDLIHLFKHLFSALVLSRRYQGGEDNISAFKEAHDLMRNI